MPTRLLNIQNALIVESDTQYSVRLSKIVQQRIGVGSRIYTTSSFTQALNIMALVKFDFALLDIDLPDGSGLGLLEELSNGTHNAYCIMLTSHNHTDSIIQSLKKGAKGYILKGEGHNSIVTKINAAKRGHPPISASAYHALIEYFQQGTTTASKLTPKLSPKLTPRETEVIQLLCRGFNRKDIATSLNISPHTVADHTKGIYQKLRVSSRAEMTSQAISLGLFQT